MRKMKIATALFVSILLTQGSITFTLADEAPMKPEIAAKKEMVRKQNEQRLTDDKRKAAANNLKAERMKVYKAKQLVGKAKKQNVEQQPVVTPANP